MRAALIPILIACLGNIYAQDSIRYGLSDDLVKKLINTHFGNLINPQSNNIIGNFASIDINEAKVNFAGNIVFNNGSVLGVKARGEIIDGLLPVFSNSKLNSGFGMDVQYNFLDCRKKSIIYDNAGYIRYSEKIAKITWEYMVREIEIEYENRKNELNIEINKLQYDLALKTKALDIMRSLHETNKNFDRDSLLFQIKRVEIETKKLESELLFMREEMITLPSGNALLFEMENRRNEEMRDAGSELEVYGFSMGWFSIGYGIFNNSFRLFDPDLQFDQQLSKASFASPTLRLQYNYYRLTPAAYESYFVSFGTSFSIEDNLTSLTRVQIEETKELGTNPGERQSTVKYSAYSGSYKKDLAALAIYGDFYYFLFADNKGAVHFYPEHMIIRGNKSFTNLGFGFLLTFRNRDNSANLINSEIYIHLSDISGNWHTEEKLISRSTFGLRFTFPIKFSTKS